MCNNITFKCRKMLFTIPSFVKFIAYVKFKKDELFRHEDLTFGMRRMKYVATNLDLFRKLNKKTPETTILKIPEQFISVFYQDVEVRNFIQTLMDSNKNIRYLVESPECI